MRKNLIIINDKEKAKDYLRKILNDVHFMDVKRYTESDDQIVAITNTDEYEWVRGNLVYTGNSADCVHIEDGIDINLMQKVYLPLIANSTAENKIFYVDVKKEPNLLQIKVRDILSKYTLPKHITNEIVNALSDIDGLMFEYFNGKFAFVPEFIEEQTTTNVEDTEQAEE